MNRLPSRLFLFSILLAVPLALRAADDDALITDYYNKAVDAAKREDYDGAKIYLKEIAARDPQCAEALYLRGLLRYHDNDIEGGNTDIEEAYRLKPALRDERAKQLERRAHTMESGMTGEAFSHFTLEFNGAERRDAAWQAVQSLNGMYNELGSRFGVFPKEKFTVIIFTTDEFLDIWRAPFLGGFFDRHDGKVRLRVDETPGGDAEFRHRARHEFTHAYLHRRYAGELPSWFSEGTAEFYALESPTNGFWMDERLEAIRQELKQIGAPWMTMEEVNHAILKKDVPVGYIYVAYKESEALVLYTAKARGESWIPRLYETLHAGQPFDAAYQSAAGHTPAEMLEALHHTWQ